ncbi:MAG TPA: hypothetical protein ENI88_12565 [Desulfobulbus sp.]|nr:hypothetical protein [Desulfobulbus sp.]
MQEYTGETEQWLKVSAHVLMEEPERLQSCILTIYKDRPEMCSYATELAQLRMTSPTMESSLLQIWSAKTADSVDLIVRQNNHDHPAGRALSFLADLVKKDLERAQTVH